MVQGIGQGFGTTITFENGFFAKIRNVSLSDVGDRDVIDLSNGDETFSRNEPSSILKTGEARITMLYDPTKGKPPFDKEPAQATITNPKGVNITGMAWLRQPGIEIPYKGEMLMTCTLMFSELPTFGAPA